MEKFKFDVVSQSLVITARFAEAMNNPQSAEYKLVSQFSKDFPNLTITRKTHKSATGYITKDGERFSCNQFKNLTYKNMEAFMPEQVNAGFLHTTGAVIVGNSKPQGVLREHFPILIAKQILRCFSLAYRHVFPENGNHLRTQRNRLNLAILRMPIHNLPRPQIHVPNLDVPHSRRPASAIEQEINNHPVSVFRKGTT